MSKKTRTQDEVKVTLTTESGDELEAMVKRESVKVYERNGWTVADDGSSEEVQNQDQNDAVPTQADEGQEV